MIWWVIGFGLWILAGWPLTALSGFLYSKQWDGAIYGYLLILCVLAALPLLAINWGYQVVRYGKAKPGDGP